MSITRMNTPEPEALILYHRKGLKFGEVPVPDD